MGLDMYLLRVTTLTDDEKHAIDELVRRPLDCTDRTEPYWKKRKETLPEGVNEIIVGWESDSDEAERLENIMAYIYQKSRDVITWDDYKLKVKFGIPMDAFYAGGELGVSRRYRTEEGADYRIDLLDIPDKDSESLVKCHTYDAWYMKACEIGYWRKEYDLQEKLHEAWNEAQPFRPDYRGILNCGYYPLNKKMKKLVLSKKFKTGEYEAEDLDKTENSVVCYHEWY